MSARVLRKSSLLLGATVFCLAFCAGQPVRASSAELPSGRQAPGRASRHSLAATRAGEIAGGPWILWNRTYRPEDFTQEPFVGNGYLGLRIPAIGEGYQGGNLGKSGFPLFNERYTSALVAGVYENARLANPFEKTGPSDYISSLPTWSEMDLTVDGQTLNSGVPVGQVSDYRQSVNMRDAIVSTSFRWTPSPGKAIDVNYQVLANRAYMHLGEVKITFKPTWSGELTLAGLLNAAGAERITAISRQADTATDVAAVMLRTPGRNTEVVEKQLLIAEPGAKVTGRTALLPAGESGTAGEGWAMEVTAGKTYQVIKYVGISTSNDSGVPETVALHTVQAAARAGWPALLKAHTLAWERMWEHNITVPPQNELQVAVNSAFYLLYSSVRAGVAWSIPPTGLTSDNYAGEIFWDADTWMFPALLGFHPELAKSIVDFRYDTKSDAEANARKDGYRGGMWAWDDGPTGVCGGLAPCKHYEDHLQSDIALAQWQYYEATGDKQWLVERGFPVIKDVAEFWLSRVTLGSDGKYHILGVTGPDEFTAGVNDESATNAGAIVALRDAIAAAKAAGYAPNPLWAKVAANIVVARNPNGTHPEYVGYAGQTVKQADTVLMTYPFHYVTNPAVAAADLRQYMAVTDPGGPAMTTSVEAIIAAQAKKTGNLDYKLMQDSYLPFLRGAYDQFLETRYLVPSAHQGPPSFDFATGAGGFLQIFPYGFAGLRWSPSALILAPTLPPQLREGITMRGVRYHGSQLTIAIGPHATTVTLVSGAPVSLSTRTGTITLRVNRPVKLPTD